MKRKKAKSKRIKLDRIRRMMRIPKDGKKRGNKGRSKDISIRA